MSEGVNINKVRKRKQSKSDSGDVFAFLNKDISIGSKFGLKKKEAFYSELSILLAAGIDIRSALEVIEGEQKKGYVKDLIGGIKDDIIRGGAFSEVLSNQKHFSPYEYQTIQIGEETGKLAHVLIELAEHFKKVIKQKRQIVNALSYPIIVLFVAFGAVGFMVTFIVPMFADMFARFDSELPGITVFVINLSEWVQDNYMYIFLGAMFLVVLWFLIRRFEWYKNYSTKLLLWLPIIGPIVRKVQLSRLATTMALLLNSKTPLLQSIILIQKIMTFYPIHHSLKVIEKDIVQGVSLSESMSAFSVYPQRMVSLIKVGEQVNKTEEFFRKIAEQYNEEVEHQTGILGNLLEPILLIFLGGVIGTILIAMYLPLFKLSTTIQF